MYKRFKYRPAVIGLGYVGLPLLAQIARKYKVTGFDINKIRVNELSNNLDTTYELSVKHLKEIRENVIYESDEKSLLNKNFYIITVPTPIKRNKDPDLSYIYNATKCVSKYIKKGDIIVYECTVYPGVTEKYCGDIISKNTGFLLNKDFFLGYSPERINPGDKKNTIDKIIKVVSGSNLFALNKISKFYKKIIPAGIFKAKNIKTAESAKVIENIQRDLNISLINEFSQIFHKLGLDTYDILKAAKTKWNFLDFEPGLVGGHCIGIDPYYLTYLSKKVGHNPKLILAGRKINENMVELISKKFFFILKEKNIDVKKAEILFLGLTFKENCPDLRNSKNLNLCYKISKKVKNFNSYDPFLKKDQIDKKKIKRYKILFSLPKKKYDAVIIAVGHDYFLNKNKFNVKKLLKRKSIFFDLKHKFTKFNPDFTL